MRALAADAPERREERRVARVGGRRRRRPVRRAIAHRDRLHGRLARSTIGCSSELLNGSSRVPSVVVPSGNIATTSPLASASCASIVTRCVSWRRERSTNSVPTSRTRRPSSGQRASSDLATKRIGCTEFSTKMSSHETWFATISTLPPSCNAPTIRTSTASIRSSRADQWRTRWRRDSADNHGKTTTVVARPSNRCSTVRIARAARRGADTRAFIARGGSGAKPSGAPSAQGHAGCRGSWAHPRRPITTDGCRTPRRGGPRPGRGRPRDSGRRGSRS